MGDSKFLPHPQYAPPEFPPDGYATAEWCEQEANKMGFTFKVSGFAERPHNLYDEAKRIIKRCKRVMTVRDGHGRRLVLNLNDKVRWWRHNDLLHGTVKSIDCKFAVCVTGGRSPKEYLVSLQGIVKEQSGYKRKVLIY